MSEDRIAHRAHIEGMPRLAFSFGKDWISGPTCYAIGIMWDRNFDAEEGELIYRRKIILHWRFNMWLDWQPRPAPARAAGGRMR